MEVFVIGMGCQVDEDVDDCRQLDQGLWIIGCRQMSLLLLENCYCVCVKVYGGRLYDGLDVMSIIQVEWVYVFGDFLL